jgi:putative membrane protein
MHMPLLGAVMSGALLFAAVMFWSALLGLAPGARWQAVPALLVTGKLVCLLGALLIFAMHPLYGHGTADGLDTLTDQQLAGLLMVTACPLSYLLAGIVIAARFLSSLERRPLASSRLPRAG